MKKQLLILATSVTLLLSCNNSSLTSNEKDIQHVVQAFVKHGDSRNVSALSPILHNEFRVIVNRAFGSDSLSTLTKKAYLDLLSQGIIGGDSRTVSIQSINVDQHNAIVHALFSGKTAVFNSILLLAQNKKGKWKILTDMPTVKELEL